MKLILQHLKFLHDTSGTTCAHMYEGTMNSVQAFCISLLERLTHAALSLITLFEAMQHDRAYEFGAGILTRSLVLDTLIGMNLFLIMKQAEADGAGEEETNARIKEFCEIMLSDGLEQTLKYLDSAREFGFIDDHQLAESYTNFGQTHKHFFDNYPEDGTRPKQKYTKHYSPVQLFKNLANQPEMQNVAKLYDAYSYFSKYDHFGIMSAQLIREPWPTKMKIYLNVVEAFIAAQAFLHVVLVKQSNGDTFVNQQSRVSNGYLLEQIIKRSGT